MYKKILVGMIALLLIAKPVAAFAPNAYVHDSRVAPWQRMIQGDDRWGHLPHGSGTIRDRGCYTTAVAILMAYANEGLRCIDTWNPSVATPILSPEGLMIGSNTTRIDPEFRLVNQRLLSGGTLSPEAAMQMVVDLWFQGYYIVIRATGMLTHNTHFSPIVGIDDHGVPIVWDTAGYAGTHNFYDWANHGIDQIAIWRHTNPSYLTQNLGDFGGEIDLERERLASLGIKGSIEEEYEVEETEEVEENSFDITMQLENGFIILE